MLLMATEVGVANALDLVPLFEALDDLHRLGEHFLAAGRAAAAEQLPTLQALARPVAW
jgi:hypothetical protein